MHFEPISIKETPEVFHHRTFDDLGRTLWVPTLSESPTLVLGSSQSLDTLDRDFVRSSNITLATRRSGGGAVLVGRDDLVWFDVVLPSTDPLWHHDVSRSFDWLGEVVQRALVSLGVNADLYTGPLVTTEWARRICFAGLGPGELTIDGHKVVGMSQRRTRTASRIQVAILLRWDAERHANMLLLNPDEKQRAISDLERAAVGLPHQPAEILEAVVRELNS